MADIQEWKPSINPWLMIIPVILAAFICILDTTVGNVALPHMAGTFSVSRDESMWILTSYLVAAGIIMPAVDWLWNYLKEIVVNEILWQNNLITS